MACLLLALAAPLLAAIAIAIILESGTPVLFRQRRVGLAGTEFTMIKFRTLRCGVGSRSQEMTRLNEAAFPLFKISNDPRSTRVGLWLRRTGLDELPQLLNVILGQMSLVGPRPLVPEEMEALPRGFARVRSSCRPGLTGPWQLAPDRHVDLAYLVDADVWYVKNHALSIDLRIIAATFARWLPFGKWWCHDSVCSHHGRAY